ncbi:hypothetical protein MY11210_001325 [Beauveria gryllotalpidicola]
METPIPSLPASNPRQEAILARVFEPNPNPNTVRRAQNNTEPAPESSKASGRGSQRGGGGGVSAPSQPANASQQLGQPSYKQAPSKPPAASTSRPSIRWLIKQTRRADEERRLREQEMRLREQEIRLRVHAEQNTRAIDAALQREREEHTS